MELLRAERYEFWETVRLLNRRACHRLSEQFTVHGERRRQAVPSSLNIMAFYDTQNMKFSDNPHAWLVVAGVCFLIMLGAVVLNLENFTRSTLPRQSRTFSVSRNGSTKLKQNLK